jgi:TRAP-type C4-dicarboxylate transport system permease small subunit
MASFDHIINVLTYFAGGLLYFIMVGVVLTLILRPLGSALTWMFETTEYAMLYITFLGTAWVLKREGHVKTELLLSRLNLRTGALLNSITSVLAAISCLVIALYGAMITWEYYQIGYVMPTEWRPPMAPIIVIIPVGCFLLFIQFLRRSYGYLERWRGSADT